VNLILLRPEELAPDGTARLTGRRAAHAREVLGARRGEVLRAGVLGGLLGEATVLSSTRDELVLQLSLTQAPPPRPGIDLLLAIPRPKALKKILPAAASLGVDKIVLVNAARVEKSYFDSKVLDRGFLDELLALGLEQARDTRPPEVLVRERFRPFAEDELDRTFGPSRRLAAHPQAHRALEALPAREPVRTVLAVGPEGGWVPFELELLAKVGFEPFTAGPRPLRVEVAVPYLLGRLERSQPLC